jgi:hypothetical protein
MTTQIVAYPEATLWLYDKLISPAITGVKGVYEDAAPEGETDGDDVWVEFESLAPGTDVAEVAEQRIWTEYAFLVRAITRGRSTVALKTIATTIDSRLHRSNGTTTDGQVISCTRSQEEQDHWLEQGVEYRGSEASTTSSSSPACRERSAVLGGQVR